MRVLGIVHTFDELAQADRRLGRKVANHGLVAAALKYSDVDELHLFVPFASALGPMQKVYGPLLELPRNRARVRLLPSALLPKAAAEVDYLALHATDPEKYFMGLCHLRNQAAENPFPVTCTTHTLSYWDHQVKNLYKVLPGAMPWDAVFCTSRTARDYCAKSYGALAGGLRELGLEGAGFKGRLEIVPLGVEPDDFGTMERKAAQAALGLPPGGLNLLYLGRINPADKADLMPLLGAASLLAERHDLRLILAGAAQRAYTDELFKAAGELGIKQRLFIVPDFDSAQKAMLFGAADVFVSPADNIQETFGLSILEAMASKLPVVAAGFSGYRDLVLEGETGFLVPTLGPPSFEEPDAARPLMADHVAAMQVSQRTALDMDILLERLDRLLADAELRRDMGLAGRTRVESEFAWPKVMARMEQTWAGLKQSAAWAGPRPADLLGKNLATAFAHFAGGPPEPDDVYIPGPLAGRMRALPWAAQGPPDLAGELAGGGALQALGAVESLGGAATMKDIAVTVNQGPSETDMTGPVLRALKLGLLSRKTARPGPRPNEP